MSLQKVTKNEFDDFVQTELNSQGFTRAERDAVSDAFFDDVNDAEHGEGSTIMHNVVPGVDAAELKRKMAILRDPYSVHSKNSRYPLHKYPTKLDIVEKVMTEALEKKKERHWF